MHCLHIFTIYVIGITISVIGIRRAEGNIAWTVLRPQRHASYRRGIARAQADVFVYGYDILVQILILSLSQSLAAALS
jgi:hypothetical protein